MRHFTFFTYNKDFDTFGTQHLVVLGISFFLCIALPYFAKHNLSAKRQLWLSRIMALWISFGAFNYIFILLLLGDFNYKTDLPFDVCNFTAAILPFIMWKPTKRVHEILYFWILAGTMQGIITPHLYNGFPNFIFIKYWTVHGGLVVYAIYITYVFGFKPTIRSIWKAFILLLGYLVVIYFINLLLGSNYAYVVHKPPTSSVLDYFGPWPVYIFVGATLGLLLFFIVYAPLELKKK